MRFSSEEEEEEEEEEEVAYLAVSRNEERTIKDGFVEYWKDTANNPYYPEFIAEQGPADRMNPDEYNALDYFQVFWGEEMHELLAMETNRYGASKMHNSWITTNPDEIRAFLGVIILMGYHRLPRFSDYWSSCDSVGVVGIQRRMTYARFMCLWRNLHVVDNSCADRSDKFYKVRPIIRLLKNAFLSGYQPAQELSLDETMIKCRGRAKGKVFMPKKPIKRGFKMYSLSCACCGYLCDFELFSGKELDPVSGKRLDKPKKIADSVKELLVGSFSGCNHVVYMDRFFTNAPLVTDLKSVKIFTVGTVRKDAIGFPESLKLSHPNPGEYCATREKEIAYYIYNDRQMVCFISNVFPLYTCPMLARPKTCRSGELVETNSMPPLVPAYNKYMGGVDRTNQMCSQYLIDHRCHRSWMRIFFHLQQLAVTNAYISYKHNYRLHNANSKHSCKSSLDFRQELVQLCLNDYCSRKRKVRNSVQAPLCPPALRASSAGCVKHELTAVANIGLKRGRCALSRACLGKGSTSFACKQCKIRLCKTACFAHHHSQAYLQVDIQ